MNIKVYWFVSLFATLALVAVACSPTTATVSDEDPAQGAVSSETDSEEDAAPATDIPVDAGSSAGATIDVPDDVELIEGGEPPRSAEQEFETDFTRTTVLFSEILSGGPPKDGIPAVDDPKYISTSEADEWLKDVEPIALVEINGQARAFPIQILIWHEIVNAEVGGQPVSVTFCPLCNTAIAFNRELDSLVMDFGTTGRLRFSNLVMYDRQTETWWQQATGEAIIGEQVGKQLEYLPLSMISWQQFKDNYP
ncbi:MAG: DUF3179 domain-containing protein, partial [Chloroflexi bacterium]|nr:DUF3179 domain-containing protein [Chloroflexota bacterium]NOH14781.1 DUF3179 domain-containing protein [Chloroflexota bacterium]